MRKQGQQKYEQEQVLQTFRKKRSESEMFRTRIGSEREDVIMKTWAMEENEHRKIEYQILC